MPKAFDSVATASIPRSSFDLSHRVLQTFDADYLVPIDCWEVLPGDSFKVDMTHFCRLATPIHPIMDNLYLETFFFFCPMRLLWKSWDKFLGAQEDPTDSIDFTIPTVGTNTATPVSAYPVFQYLGLPYNRDCDLTKLNSLPARMYHRTWNEWFRDQNLQDSAWFSDGDGTDGISNYTTLLKRGKRADYLTTCLPSPQKGDAVSITLGTSAEIVTTSSDNNAIIVGQGLGGSTQTFLNAATSNVQNAVGTTGSATNLFADMSTAVEPTVNDFRLAFQMQALLERDARAGTRLTEVIWAHFGVRVPDYRLQRVEFLGGGSSRVNITPVPNTAPADDVAARDQGELAGFGTSSGTHGFTKGFVEHGYVMCLINLRGDITYQDGIHKMWNRSTRFDFYYPVLSQLGEQAVLVREIYADASSGNDENVFGYQERYGEYRYLPNRLGGLFKSRYSQSLDPWHLAEDYTAEPSLGDTWIQSNTGAPLDRAIADSGQPHMIGDFYFKVRAARPMPMHGTPLSLGRF